MVFVGAQPEQPAVGRQGQRPRQAQRIGIGLQRLEALGAAAVGLGQGRPHGEAQLRLAEQPHAVGAAGGLDPGAARREGQRAAGLPAPAQMHRGETMLYATVAPRQHDQAAAAEGEVGEAARRRIDRIEHQHLEGGGIGVRFVERGAHRLPGAWRPGRRALQAQAVVRQATELAVLVEHPGRRREQALACARGRQAWQARGVLAGQREGALLVVPAALPACVVEVGRAVEEQEAGAVAVHGRGLDQHRSGITGTG
ncbi:MAG TPA: hypothetical protein PLH95_07315, partial [Thauera aminoaromatica]|nr:hypothetical protein [Thauera aminoaromatica]